MPSISLQRIVEKAKLEPLTPEIPIEKIKIKQPDINRPALQMAGFFENYEATRMQIIGFVEYRYMESLSPERKEEIYSKLLSYPIPCIVFCRDLEPDELFRKKAVENGVPLFKTKNTDYMVTGILNLTSVPVKIYASAEPWKEVLFLKSSPLPQSSGCSLAAGRSGIHHHLLDKKKLPQTWNSDLTQDSSYRFLKLQEDS